MWKPIKIKKSPSVPLEDGWYVAQSLHIDTSRRYSAKQSAQKECNRRNSSDTLKKSDGLLRNPKKWFTIGYFNQSKDLTTDPYQSNIFQYHGYLTDLTSMVRDTLREGYVKQAYLAVVWSGQLSRYEALHSATAPIRHIYSDGSVTP